MFRSCIICVLYFWTVFFCIHVVLHAVLWLNFTSDVFTVYSLYCLLHSEMIVDEWFLFTFQQIITISLVIIKILPAISNLQCDQCTCILVCDGSLDFCFFGCDMSV